MFVKRVLKPSFRLDLMDPQSSHHFNYHHHHYHYHHYQVNIMPQLRLASYSVGVSITETMEISQIGARRLSFKQGASDDSEETVEGAEIMMSPTDPGKVTISYNPDVRRLQTEPRTEKHPLQLIV